MKLYTEEALRTGTEAWTWLIAEKQDLQLRCLNELVDSWEWAISKGRGIYSHKHL